MWKGEKPGHSHDGKNEQSLHSLITSLLKTLFSPIPAYNPTPKRNCNNPKKMFETLKIEINPIATPTPNKKRYRNRNPFWVVLKIGNRSKRKIVGKYNIIAIKTNSSHLSIFNLK